MVGLLAVSVEMLAHCVLLIVAVTFPIVTCATKKGSCPPTLSVDLCEAACSSNDVCDGTELCCPTACGGSMCVDAMSQRHFVNLVKPGKCPEFPRGPWVCSHTCTGDSDCPRKLKCCANRCGALTCQKPETEEVVAEPI